jgi:hypothetical protein
MLLKNSMEKRLARHGILEIGGGGANKAADSSVNDDDDERDKNSIINSVDKYFNKVFDIIFFRNF